MISIGDIKKNIEKEMTLFNQVFDKTLESDNDILKLVNEHVKSMKGKQIRPTMTILAAKLISPINQVTLQAAAALELLHTASLVHDDVVDNSDMRRGMKSVNALWDNRISILSGDYIISQSSNLALETGKLDIVKVISKLGSDLAEGELLQIRNVQTISTNEDRYIDVIKKKTAKLFSACMRCGGLSVNATEEEMQQLELFGEKYGILFQMRDDIFDYVSTASSIGKPVGNDIREGKITLPLIYAYNQGNEAERKVIMEIYKQKDFTKENVQEIVDFTLRKGGIEYAEKRILDFKKEAEDILTYFGKNDASESLQCLLDYSVQRKN